MLATKKRRVWFVLSVLWVVLVFAVYAWDYTQRTTLYYRFLWEGVVLFGLVPVALGWGLFAGLPAMVRWIRAGK